MSLRERERDAQAESLLSAHHVMRNTQSSIPPGEPRPCWPWVHARSHELGKESPISTHKRWRRPSTVLELTRPSEMLNAHLYRCSSKTRYEEACKISEEMQISPFVGRPRRIIWWPPKRNQQKQSTRRRGKSRNYKEEDLWGPSALGWARPHSFATTEEMQTSPFGGIERYREVTVKGMTHELGEWGITSGSAIIPLLSLPHEPVCVHFNIVVFAYDPKFFVNRLFEPYKNSHKSRYYRAPAPPVLRDFWTTEADVPLFTANGELEGGVDMLFYDGADECVGRSSDWPHRRWHLLADGQITAVMVDRVELLPPDAMAELQARFGDNSEYFESMNPDSIITIYLMISWQLRTIKNRLFTPFVSNQFTVDKRLI